MPTARGYLGVAASGGKIYAKGGMQRDSATAPWRTLAAVEAYDPTTDAWERLPDLPAPRSIFQLVSHPSGKLYAIGGGDALEQPIANVDEYDPTTGAWTPQTPLPEARFDMAASIGANGKIYVFGGLAPYSTSTSATVLEYDPTSDTWPRLADMSRERWQGAGVLAPDGKIYVLGGYYYGPAGGVYLTEVDVFDPALGTWHPAPDMPAHRIHPAAAYAEGRLYVLGGRALNEPATARVDVYDLAAGAWSQAPSVAIARSGLGAAVGPNGRLYAIGGYTGSAMLATVEEATLPPSQTVYRPLAVSRQVYEPGVSYTLSFDRSAGQNVVWTDFSADGASSAELTDWTANGYGGPFTCYRDDGGVPGPIVAEFTLPFPSWPVAAGGLAPSADLAAATRPPVGKTIEVLVHEQPAGAGYNRYRIVGDAAFWVTEVNLTGNPAWIKGQFAGSP